MKTASLLLITSLLYCRLGTAQSASAPILGDPAAIHLLQDTASNYQTLTEYQFHANVNLVIPGQPWQFDGEAKMIGPRELLPDGRADMRQAGGQVGAMKPTTTGTTPSGKPPSIVTPFSLLMGFDKIADHLLRVERTGSEVLKVNGQDVACEILAATYMSRDSEDPNPKRVTYSIAPAQDLVVRKGEKASAGRSISGLWTVTFDSMKFNQPTPQWLLNMANLPKVALRKDWTGKRAPDFSLTSMDGSTVTLSSLRGKVVLLNFWSITCGPCKLEIPTLEDVAAHNKAQGVQLLGVSFDPIEKSRAWLERNQRNMTTLTDADFKASDAFQVHGIPALVLIGRNGKVQQYWDGTVPQVELQAAINRAVKK